MTNVHQVARGARVYGAGKCVLVALIKMDKIEPFLKYEKADSNSERSGFFAHMYGNLKTDDIEKTWQIKRGAFILPKLILLEAEL